MDVLQCRATPVRSWAERKFDNLKKIFLLFPLEIQVDRSNTSSPQPRILEAPQDKGTLHSK